MITPARLLHIFSTFDYGGAEARTLQLMQNFGQAADHTVLIGERSAMGAVASIEPGLRVTIPEQGGPAVLGRPGVRRYYQLAHYMRGFDRVLTYSWGAMDAIMAHRIFGRMMGLPPLIHHEDGYEEGELSQRHIHFRRLAMPTCQKVIVPSAELEAFALRHWQIPRHRLQRISNGIAVSRYAVPAKQGSFPGLQRHPGDIVVGTVAGLRTVKNLPRLVRAVAAAGANIRLAIAGEGTERAAIEAEALRLGIIDRLHMPGFLSDPASFLGHFDIFAMSSDSEQFPIAMAEAMAAGLPVVATDVGDVRAMVAAANAAFIVPVSDEAALARAIANLASDRALRTSIGRDNAARARAEFPQDRMFAHYRALYGIGLSQTGIAEIQG